MTAERSDSTPGLFGHETGCNLLEGVCRCPNTDRRVPLVERVIAHLEAAYATQPEKAVVGETVAYLLSMPSKQRMEVLGVTKQEARVYGIAFPDEEPEDD